MQSLAISDNDSLRLALSFRASNCSSCNCCQGDSSLRYSSSRRSRDPQALSMSKQISQWIRQARCWRTAFFIAVWNVVKQKRRRTQNRKWRKNTSYSCGLIFLVLSCSNSAKMIRLESGENDSLKIGRQKKERFCRSEQVKIYLCPSNSHRVINGVNLHFEKTQKHSGCNQ